MIDNNLHVTNWKRKLGCKCQHKHVVDWCGCSPNVYLTTDWTRILSTQEHDLYFARKFEPTVDQEIINRLEAMILEEPLASRGHHDPTFGRYWQSAFHHLDKSPITSAGSLTAFRVLAHRALDEMTALCPDLTASNKSLTSSPDLITVLQVTIFMEQNQFKGLLVNFQPDAAGYSNQHNGTSIEAFVSPVKHFTTRKRSPPMHRLVALHVCSDWDQKEKLFRNWGCILSPESEITLMHRWIISAGKNLNFSVTFAWTDPSGSLVAATEAAIDTPLDPEHEELVLFFKPKLPHPLRPGVWRLLMLHADRVAAESEFLIVPILLPANAREKTSITGSLSSSSGRRAGVGDDFNYYNITDPKLNLPHIQTVIREHNMHHNKHHTHKSLEEGEDAWTWTDSLFANFWSFEGACVHSAAHDHHLSRTDSHSDRHVLLPDTGCKAEVFAKCDGTYWSSFSPDPKSEISVLT